MKTKSFIMFLLILSLIACNSPVQSEYDFNPVTILQYNTYDFGNNILVTYNGDIGIFLLLNDDLYIIKTQELFSIKHGNNFITFRIIEFGETYIVLQLVEL